MPSFFTLAGKALRAVDLFPTSKLLRYNGQTDYNTTTGGVVSAAVITIFIILFASMGLKTVKKQIIQAQVEKINEVDPAQLNFKAGKDGGIMFSFIIMGLDLNSPPYLFDFKLLQESYTIRNTLVSSVQVPLVPCTQEHFAFNDQLKSSFNKLNLFVGLCPPLNHEFNIRGKISGDLFNLVRLQVTRCNNTLNPSSCVNDSTFSSYQTLFEGQFKIILPIINTNINPSSDIYKQFYLEDQNSFIFSSTLGAKVTADIQEDIIQTDTSLMPYEDILSENIVYYPQTFKAQTYLAASNGINFDLTFKKSPRSAKYSRNFNKIDAYFSYVGGLVGTIIGLIFIMGPYTEKAYEISLARKVMLDNDKGEIESKSFSLWYFIVSYFKEFLDFIKVEPDWPKTQLFMDSSEEVTNQIDVTYIVRKLMFLDAAITKLMEKHEVDALYVREKPTLQKAKEQRKKHFAPEMIRQSKEKEDEDRSTEKQRENNKPPESKGTNSDFESSPSHMKFRRKDQEGQEGQEAKEDISALGFSQKEVEIDGIKASVALVALRGRQGDKMCQDIMEEISPEMLRQLGLQPPSEKTKGRIQNIHASNLSEEDRYYEMMKVQPLDKDFNINLDF